MTMRDKSKPECQRHSSHDAAEEKLLQLIPRQQEHLGSSEIQPEMQ